jgi:hypothetical protein
LNALVSRAPVAPASAPGFSMSVMVSSPSASRGGEHAPRLQARPRPKTSGVLCEWGRENSASGRVPIAKATC